MADPNDPTTGGQGPWPWGWPPWPGGYGVGRGGGRWLRLVPLGLGTLGTAATAAVLGTAPAPFARRGTRAPRTTGRDAPRATPGHRRAAQGTQGAKVRPRSDCDDERR